MTDKIYFQLLDTTKASQNEITKYIHELTRFEAPTTFFDKRLSSNEKKEVSAAYYTCATELTSHFDKISRLSSDLIQMINNAKALNDEDKIKTGLVAFEKIISAVRVYETFLSESESVMASNKAEPSLAKLKASANAFYIQISLLTASLTDS